MRGRTNITQRSGTVPVNGDVKEFVVANGNNINIGDFVSIFYEGESDNLLDIYGDNVYPEYEYVGELNGKKIIYVSNVKNINNSKIIVFDENGDIVLITTIGINLYGKRGIKTACLVGQYLVVCGYSSYSSSYPSTFYLYRFSSDCKILESLGSYSFNNAGFGVCSICEVGVDVFISVYYRNSSIKGISLFKIEDEEIKFVQDGSSVFNSLNNLSVIAIPNKNKNGAYIILRDTYDNSLVCGNIIVQDYQISYNDISKLSLSSINYFGSWFFVNDNTFFIFSDNTKSTSGQRSFMVFEIIDEKIVFKMISEIPSISYNGYSLNPRYSFLLENNNIVFIYSRFNNANKIYYLFLYSYDNGVMVYEDELGELLNEDSNVFTSMFVLKSNSFLLFYNYVEETSTSIFKMEFNIIDNFIIKSGGSFVTEYNGKSIGFAKTGGSSGDIIQVYVPKEIS